jgi:hypothetical protein
MGMRADAAKQAKIPISTVNMWFRQDEKFIADMSQALIDLATDLKVAGLTRAMKKSDTLTCFFLKAHDPETYDDQIRRLKWLKDNEMKDPDNQPSTILLIRGEDRPSVERALNGSAASTDGNH